MPKIRVDTKTFRSPDQNYWHYVFCITDGKTQTSPFITVTMNKLGVEIKAVYKISDLIEEFAKTDEVTILQAWPGQWNTDIFHYTIADFYEAMVSEEVCKLRGRRRMRGYEQWWE